MIFYYIVIFIITYLLHNLFLGKSENWSEVYYKFMASVCWFIMIPFYLICIFFDSSEKLTKGKKPPKWL